MPSEAVKADSTARGESLWRTVAAVITLAVTIGAILIGYTHNRIAPVETKVNAIEVKVDRHAGNSSIHRTAEEAREFTEGQDARWNQLFRELDQLGKRIDNIERRSQ